MKNPPKVNTNEGPPPVIGHCGGCGAAFHSKFEKKRHRCRGETHHG